MRTVVIAGWYGQFKDWCRENDVPPSHPGVYYISDVRSLYGISNVDIKLYGTYYERKDWPEIQEELERIKLRKEE